MAFGKTSKGDILDVEKAVIILYGENNCQKKIPVLFNPSDYNISRNVNYAKLDIPGTDSPIMQFINGGETSLKLTLHFDTQNDYIQNKIPDSVLTYVGEKQELDLPAFFKTEQSVPALHVQNQDGSFSMKSNRLGSYEVSVRLFGVLPVKRMDVKVVKRKKIFPSGEPIGIYVETNGLLVLDTTEVPAKDGLTYAPGENLLKPGDYILEWNQKKVATIQSLNREIQGTKDKKVTVLIRRNGEKIKIAMRPVLSSDGTYKIGTWVREDTQGIGTLTYVTKTGEFGTLGHGITDVDTGTLLNLHGGELFQTQIVDIMKGEKGNPGELQGYINMIAKNTIGKIKKNTEQGVFGEMKQERVSAYSGKAYEVGRKQEIEAGKAYLYANLEGRARMYEIEIEDIKINARDNKSMEIRVTDKKLLKLTGGIVQGMSGSPIIQNDKIVGAVTHVFVDDPTRGYGIFIEEMLVQ